jgi:hypothetical protein
MMNKISFLIILVWSTIPCLFSAGADQSTGVQLIPQLFETSDRCLACHNGLTTPTGKDVSIGSNWQASMMANASRDPYWQAAVRRETMEHPEAQGHIQHECAACHMPMARFEAHARGEETEVFTHLPTLPDRDLADRLSADGVSCTLCHQIEDHKLGTEESFTAGFVVETRKQFKQRSVYGPFDVDAGRTRVMQSSGLFEPKKGNHIQDSGLCGSCHTLYTQTLGPGGEILGSLPEQVPYLEWEHSRYDQEQSCQSCHMPQIEESMPITSVLGQPRDALSRHAFRGGNFFMLNMLRKNASSLAVTASPEDLEGSVEETLDNLRTAAARVSIEDAHTTEGSLEVVVSVSNLTGHKLPTAYPSRRVWIHLKVQNDREETVFESGALHPDGSIAGNDNDRDQGSYEAHHSLIESAEQVQIYEAIMADRNDSVTTGLLNALRFVKDNRILPAGFMKETAPKDVTPHGLCKTDEDFHGGGDRVRYRLNIDETQGPFNIQAELWYQPISFRWAKNLTQYQAPETQRFGEYYDVMSDSTATLLARNSRLAP